MLASARVQYPAADSSQMHPGSGHYVGIKMRAVESKFPQQFNVQLYRTNMLRSLIGLVALSLLAVAAPLAEERAADACTDVIVRISQPALPCNTSH